MDRSTLSFIFVAIFILCTFSWISLTRRKCTYFLTISMKRLRGKSMASFISFVVDWNDNENKTCNRFWRCFLWSYVEVPVACEQALHLGKSREVTREQHPFSRGGVRQNSNNNNNNNNNNNDDNNLIFILRKMHVNMIKCALHKSKLSTLISYPK